MATLPLTAAQFRADFPEFTDTITYPNAVVTFWIGIAELLVANACRWSTLQPFGQELFVAHNVVLQTAGLADVSVGNEPQKSTGAISARSVDKTSVSYDTANTLELDGGHWNLTNYGKQFLRLAKMVGAGGLQL